MYRLLPILFAFACLVHGTPLLAAPPSIAVVYPDVREPYREVFLEIVRGMEAELGQPVALYPLNDTENGAGTLTARMKGDGITVVIALGQAGYVAAKTLSAELPVVVGAVLLPPGPDSQGLSGISLIPDPDILLARLKDLVPKAKEVTVIYDPRRESGEITRAREVAEGRGVTLHALPAADLRLSAETYRQVMGEITNDSAAIWLPRNNVVTDEQALLPLVLREAWDKSFVVFSSNVGHVKKGALFALYPDNFGLGRSLALLAKSRGQEVANRGGTIEPLRDLLLAVNLRTADHLGLHFATELARSFGVTFPRRP